jgi:hypothetical protein
VFGIVGARMASFWATEQSIMELGKLVINIRILHKQLITIPHSLYQNFACDDQRDPTSVTPVSSLVISL